MCALVAVQVLMAVLHIGARPVWRGFFCDDETIRYRYSSDTVTVSMLLICLFVVIPITVSTRHRDVSVLLTPVPTKYNIKQSI